MGLQNTAETKGIALAAAAAVAFGTLAIFAKLAYDDGAEAIPLLTARFLIGTGLTAAYLAARRRKMRVPRGPLVKLILLGAFGYAFEASLFFAALERAPAGVVGLIFYSYPLWTTLIGFATRLERFHWRTVIALAMGTAGVVLVFTLPDAPTAGMLLALAAAVAVAVYFTLAQVAIRGVDPAAGALWTSVGAALALTLVSVATRSGLPAAALPEAAGLGLATATAFLLFYRALALIGSARSSIAMMLEPVATIVLAAAVLDETPSARVLAGAILVVAALPILAGRRELTAE